MPDFRIKQEKLSNYCQSVVYKSVTFTFKSSVHKGSQTLTAFYILVLISVFRSSFCFTFTNCENFFFFFHLLLLYLENTENSQSFSSIMQNMKKRFVKLYCYFVVLLV